MPKGGARHARRRRKKRIFPKFMLFVLAAACVVCGLKLGKTIFERTSFSERSFELLLQADPRWADAPYGSSTVSASGCGPTCLSMVYIGLTGDWSMTPDAMSLFADENGYYIDSVGTSWSLMDNGAEELGLNAEEIPLNEDIIKRELEKKHPIICSVGPGDFTVEGHFIVLVEYTEDNMIRVNDPNSEYTSAQLWSYERLAPQINAMWAYS